MPYQPYLKQALLIMALFILPIAHTSAIYGAHQPYTPAPSPQRPAAKPLSSAHRIRCDPHHAPRLITFHHHPQTSSKIYLTAVFSPDDHLINRSVYTLDGVTWQTDLTPGDAACPVSIQNFISFTLGTLNAGTPPFTYEPSSHDLTAYTNFLIHTHQTCTATAMQQNSCARAYLYLPLISKQSASPQINILHASWGL